MTTKEEKEHMSKVADIGCIVCRNNGIYTRDVELHHIRAGYGVSQRASNYEVIPLCRIHYKTGLEADRTGKRHFGYHESPKDFEIAYGKEEDLLKQVLDILEEREKVQKSKYFTHYSNSSKKHMPLKEMSNWHIINTIRQIERQAKEGVEINDRLLKGEEYKEFRKYDQYMTQAKNRNIIHLL